MTDIVTIEDNTNALVATKQHYQTMVNFVKQSMQQGQDYGIIPGTNGKPTLLKPGAEKLCRLFSLRPHFDLIQSVTDFDKPLFYYHYRCTLYNRHGEALGQGEGNCNSREKRYEKQQYRVYDLANTICKIAQKRSLLSTVLVVCGASEFFTQDMDNSDEELNSSVTKQQVPKSRSRDEIWRSWKNPEDAIAWAASQLPELSTAAIHSEFDSLPAMNGKKAIAWVERVGQLKEDF